jgi:hypothetical protein
LHGCFCGLLNIIYRNRRVRVFSFWRSSRHLRQRSTVYLALRVIQSFYWNSRKFTALRVNLALWKGSDLASWRCQSEPNFRSRLEE